MGHAVAGCQRRAWLWLGAYESVILACWLAGERLSCWLVVGSMALTSLMSRSGLLAWVEMLWLSVWVEMPLLAFVVKGVAADLSAPDEQF